MKKLGIVFKFEFKELITKKSLMITTLIISLILFGVTFTPRIIDLFSKDEDTNEVVDEVPVDSAFEGLLIVAEDAEMLKTIEGFLGNPTDVTFSTVSADAKEAVQKEKYTAAYIFEDYTTFKVIRKDAAPSFMSDPIEMMLSSALYEKNLEAMGIDINQVVQAGEINFNVTNEVLGRDASQMFVFSYAILLSLYMLILLYGQQVATSVAREKDSRTMELLITSTDPKDLILGKVFAAGAVGFLQVLVMILFLVLGFTINKATYPTFVLDMLKVSVSLDILLIYAVFSFMGYLLYLFIYAALGSLVSKVEDVGSAVVSVTFIFVAAYMIASIAMNMPDATIVKVGSYIPFVSLFTTPIRYSMTSVQGFEILASLGLMFVVTILVAYLSVYIYRLGSLNYGNRMKITTVMKNIFKKD